MLVPFRNCVAVIVELPEFGTLGTLGLIVIHIIIDVVVFMAIHFSTIPFHRLEKQSAIFKIFELNEYWNLMTE